MIILRSLLLWLSAYLLSHCLVASPSIWLPASSYSCAFFVFWRNANRSQAEKYFLWNLIFGFKQCIWFNFSSLASAHARTGTSGRSVGCYLHGNLEARWPGETVQRKVGIGSAVESCLSMVPWYRISNIAQQRFFISLSCETSYHCDQGAFSLKWIISIPAQLSNLIH